MIRHKRRARALNILAASILGFVVGCSEGPDLAVNPTTPDTEQTSEPNQKVFIPKEFKKAGLAPDSNKLLSDAVAFLVYSSPSTKEYEQLAIQVKQIEGSSRIEKHACQEGGSKGEVLCELKGSFSTYGNSRFLISYIRTQAGWSIVGIDHQPI